MNQPSNEEDEAMSQGNSKREKRKGRGPTILPEIIKNRSAGVHIVVEYDDEGRPVGKDQPKFSSYLGVLARTMVPIVYKDWFEVPTELKDKLWSCVESSFDVDPRSRKQVLSSISVKWRTFKCNLTHHIRKCESDSDLLSSPPIIYSFIPPKMWQSFVKKRNCKEFEKISEIQRKSWSFNKLNHRISRKGYAKFEIELKQDEELSFPTSDPVSALNSGSHTKSKTKKLDRSVMWKKARQNKNGKYDDEEIAKQVAKIDEITRQVEDGSLPVQGNNDILTIALGTDEHSGRVRGVGGFVTPTTYFHLPRRGVHSSCEEDRKFFQASLSQMCIELDALKQSTPNKLVNVYDTTPLDPIRVENMVINKDDMPLSDHQQKFRKGKLYKLALGSREYIVSQGVVYQRVAPNEKIHTVSLGPNNVRVSIDIVIVEDALLPVPIPEEATTVGEALGYQVAWPKNLVIINYFEETPENIGMNRKRVTSKHPRMINDEVDFHLQKVDMGYICDLTMVSITCIVVYMSYLYDGMKSSNMCEIFLFVNPYIMCGTNKRGVGDEANEALLARRLQDASLGGLIVAPCNIGSHWSLFVIEVLTSTVYYLDSLKDEIPTSIKLLIHTAFIIYEGNKGNRKKSLVWKIIQCPKQPKSVECGFYVMKFMRDLIQDQSILSKNNFNGKYTYTQDELDEVRVEWINYVMTKYEEHIF